MGLISALFRLFNPLHYAKRRIKRAVIPRPIRRASWIAGGMAHPASRAKYVVRRGVIRAADKAVTPKRRRPKRRPPGRGNRRSVPIVAELEDGTPLTDEDQVVQY